MEPAPPPFPAGRGARARATGRIPELVSAAAGRRGARARAAGLVPGFPPPRPPRGRLCVLFPLVPGAATPISVRGDLREPGGEGRERLCGEPRGGARGAAWPGPALRDAAGSPVAGRGPGPACWPHGVRAPRVSRGDARAVCHPTQPFPHARATPHSPTELSQSYTIAVLIHVRTLSFFHEKVSES